MVLEIEAQGTQVHPGWRAMIDHGVRKLKRFSNEVVRIRVTLIANRHHVLGNNEARLTIHLPNAQIVRAKKGAQMGDAIRAVLGATERALKKYSRKRRQPYQKTRCRLSNIRQTLVSRSLI